MVLPEGKVGRAMGIRTIVVCLLANNLTLGMAYGSFGALLRTNEVAFAVGRDVISLGMSALATMMGLSALLFGGATRNMAPRTTMATGVLACAIAYVVLGTTTNFYVALAMWSLIGFGVAMAAILGPVYAVAACFPGKPGQILGVINLPLALLATPYLIANILPQTGREWVYLAMAASLLAPLALLAVLPGFLSTTVVQPGGRRDKPYPSSQILKKPDFWMVSGGIAIIAGTCTAFTVHIIPFGQSRGLQAAEAAILLSAFSGAGLVGALSLGWLADRIGPPATLAVSAAVQMLCWLGLGHAPTSLFLPLTIVLGAFATPIIPMHSAAMTKMFGFAGVGRAMGWSFAIKMPFLFVVTPALGFMFVTFGSYEIAFVAVAAMLLIATGLLWAGAKADGTAAGPVPELS